MWIVTVTTALWFIYPQQRIRLVPVLNLPIYLPSSTADCTYFSIIKLLIQTSHWLCGVIQTQITLHLNHPEPLRDRAYAETFLMVFMHSICTGVISNFQFSVLTEFHIVRCLSGTLLSQALVLFSSPVLIGHSCVCRTDHVNYINVISFYVSSRFQLCNTLL